MTQLHHIALFFLFLSIYLPLSLAITLPLTFGLSPIPPVPPPYTPEPISPTSTPTQPPTPPSISPLDNSTNTPNGNSYDCFKTSPFAPARPLYNDCLAAIRLLPVDPTLGRFQYLEKNPPLTIPNPTLLTNSHSSGGPSDAYRLPRFENSGTCRLILGLDYTAEHGETGSWAGVGLDAGQLNLRCVQYGNLKEFYGGRTTAGENGLITVVLLFSGTAGVGDDATEVASS